MVLAHCTSSEHALSAYKVSTKSIHWFSSYAPDRKCGRKDGRTDGRKDGETTKRKPIVPLPVVWGTNKQLDDVMGNYRTMVFSGCVPT